MRQTKRLMVLYWVLAAAWIAGWLALLVAVTVHGCQEARPVHARERVEVPDLEELEARLIAATERRRAWEELARRHAGAAELACEQMAGVALAWEVR